MALPMSYIPVAGAHMSAYANSTSHSISPQAGSTIPLDVYNTVTRYSWPVTISTILLIVSLRLLHYFFILDAPPKGLKRLPGPRSTIPWIGRVHDVDIKAPWFGWKRLSEEYGGICSSTLSGEMHVWIASQAIASELLIKKANIYSSRPEIPAIPGSDSLPHYLPLLAMGDHWRNHRRFAQMMLSRAHHAKYYGYITHETQRLMFELLRDPTAAYDLTDRFCGRIAARMGYGNPESAAAHCKNAHDFIGQISPSGPITNLIPFLGLLPEWMNPSIKSVRIRREKEEKLWVGLMKRVREDMDHGQAPVSYARSYLEAKEAETGSRAFGFGDDHEAAYAVGMLVTVAIFTISAPLYTFFLAMVLYPEWQQKVREEFDAVVGPRTVEVTDFPRLPVLRAVMKEIFRWRPPVPLGVPRLLTQDDSWNGYYLPKGTIVHAVDLAMARDPTTYPDAESFRPDRWLSPSFPTYKEPLTEHPRLHGLHSFGLGRRVCLGIDTAEAELLISCGSIIGHFVLSPVRDQDGKECPPPDWNRTSDVIGGPLPFDMVVQPRSTAHAERIQRDFEESLARESQGKLAPM